MLPGAVRAASPYPGYTFCASGATAYLLDMNGKTLHTWTASGSAQTCAYLLSDGSALFPIQNTSCSSSARTDGAYPSGRFQKISWTNVITWDYYFCDSTVQAGYDVEPMPNGDILFPADASGVSKLFEIKPSGTSGGTIVWSNTLPSSMTGSTTYPNSAKYNPALDAIVTDLQDPQRDLLVISHSTGNVLFTNYVGTSGRIHAANWVSAYFPGTTNLLPDANYTAMRTNNLLVVYNGGTEAVEISMATSNQVKTFAVAYNDHEGSVQRLPNGNTLVSIGGTTSIIELDTNGNTVATMTAPGSIDRAYRYGYAFPGVARLVTNVLTIVSAHGIFSPSATTTNAYGALVSAFASLAETNVGVALYTNAGWTLTGVRTTNNLTSGATTNLVLTMTNNAALTWMWKTNFWLTTVTNGNGTISFSGGANGWNPFGSNVTLTATASNNYVFSAWSGDTNGCSITSTQLVAPMTQARSIAGIFAIDASVLAAVSLNINLGGTGSTFTIGTTNLPAGASAALLYSTSLLNSVWQTSAMFTASSSTTNWTLSATNAAGFYRLKLNQ